jgi:hypothetical protein
MLAHDHTTAVCKEAHYPMDDRLKSCTIIESVFDLEHKEYQRLSGLHTQVHVVVVVTAHTFTCIENKGIYPRLLDHPT